MANLPRSEIFGEPGERIELEPTLKRLGVTRNGLANICQVNRSTAGRWRTWIPKAHHEKVRAALANK